MMIVSNSSVLISLSRIGKLALLKDLYTEVHIPEAVWQEAVVNGEGQVGSDEIKTAPWIRTERVKNLELMRALRQELDALRDVAGFRIAEDLYRRVLKDEKEA
jgi:predicted nucleic acid-binding protein